MFPTLFRIAAAAALAAGCTRPYVAVGVSDASIDVIVRVEWSGGSQDLLLPGPGEGEVLSGQGSSAGVTVTLLDARTCAELATMALVGEPNWFNVADGSTPGSVTLQDGPKGLSPGEFGRLSVDNRCSAS